MNGRSLEEAPLRVRGVYFSARFLAQTAQNVLLAGMFLAAGTSSSAAIDLSSVFVAILIPAIVLGPIGGATVDRIGAPTGFFIGAILRTSVAAGGLLYILDGGSPWPIAFAYSAVSQIYTPSEMALVRSLDRKHSGRAHSLLVLLQYAGQGAGMLILAPILFLLAGKTALFAGAATGFSAVVVLTAIVAFSMRGVRIARAGGGREAFTFGQTLAFFSRDSRATYAVAILALKTLVSRVVFVAMPLYLVQDMGLSGSVMIYLLAPGVLGVLVALLWCSRTLTVSTARDVMRLSLIGLAVSVFALAALDYGVTAMAQYSHVPPIVRLEAYLNTTFAVAVPISFLIGLTITASLVAARVIITELAPPNQQARVFAVSETLSEALIVAPLLFAGVGTQFAGARPVLAAVGVFLVASLLVLESRGRQGLRIEPAPTLVDDPLARTLVL